jgi:transcriptional regulator with XRE-family HTH domain
MPTPSGIRLTAAQRRELCARIMANRGNASRLAAAIGIDRRHLYSILAGRKQPSRATLAALCRAAGLALEIETTIGLAPRAARSAKSRSRRSEVKRPRR